MNSDVIRLLPDSVANMIAAGEVIQRPASVIKELVENAIDAKATEITINIKKAGSTLIQVIDDGCGMSPTDARMAFERHATSKITVADDLQSLRTMGFRGEALPSIAAVAQIEVRSMRHDDTIGTLLRISGSKFESQEPVACNPGTNMMVKNIFFNLPARRKFLKKESVELSHILREFERLALVNTDVAFTLIHNDVTLHKFPRGTFKERIGALFGKTIVSQLAQVSTETSLVKIFGYTGLPKYARRRGYNQFFFVNGRNMRHPLFHKAVLQSYEQLISPDSQPSYFINFEVEPSTIDVNIHPQKHEVKFEHDVAIYQILTAALRETLGKCQAAGGLEFDSDAPDIPLFNPTDAEVPQVDFNENFNPFAIATEDAPQGDNFSTKNTEVGLHPSASNYAPQRKSTSNWEQLYDAYNSKPTEIGQEVAQQDIFPVEKVESAEDLTPAYFQLQNRYIIGTSRGGILIIRQRQAHIRILFDRFMGLMSEGPLHSQNLFFPIDVEFAPNETALLRALLTRLNEWGFNVEEDGDCRWNIKAIPACIGNANPAEVLQAILEAASVSDNPADEALRTPVALAMASTAAIKSRQQLSAAEMETLVADLFRCTSPDFGPDGQTIISIIDSSDIDRLFSL